ncbi:hypothetical protein HanIR_Chr15g0754001 [Helianthus annuus]|nr:hypothetical protein HanIR_Chr15g0754001 [Helianthus annuus]
MFPRMYLSFFLLPSSVNVSLMSQPAKIQIITLGIPEFSTSFMGLLWQIFFIEDSGFKAPKYHQRTRDFLGKYLGYFP